MLSLFPSNRFPSKPQRKQLWLVAMHREDWSPGKHSLICSDHFKEKDMNLSCYNVRLRSDAIPVRFKKFPQHLKKVISQHKCVRVQHQKVTRL